MTFSSSYTTAHDLTLPAHRAIVLPVSSRPRHQVPFVARAGVATAATMALVLAAIRSANAGPPPDPPLALLGFVAVYGAPAMLGVVGLRRAAGSPFAAAALVAFGLAFTSFAGVTIPYLIPALLLGVAAARTGGWTIMRTFAVLAGTAMLVAAWFAVVTWREMSCYSTAQQSGCGQTMTTQGGLAALALTAAAIGLALATTRTSPRPIIPSDGAAAIPREPGE